MQIILMRNLNFIPKSFDVSQLLPDKKEKLVYLWFPIVELFPLRLVWLEWVTYVYRLCKNGKWVKTATGFHGKSDPRKMNKIEYYEKQDEE